MFIRILVQKIIYIITSYHKIKFKDFIFKKKRKKSSSYFFTKNNFHLINNKYLLIFNNDKGLKNLSLS